MLKANYNSQITRNNRSNFKYSIALKLWDTLILNSL
jgi:hypothetical protein